MKSSTNPMDALRLLQENKSCFDCSEKGTTYCVMAPHGVFVCSQCAGMHREMNHKVKGISMSVFSDADITFLRENGNKVSLLPL
jgi:late competence protein required for DNA uptake (superfamily II DNA/RNA helicase)